MDRAEVKIAPISPMIVASELELDLRGMLILLLLVADTSFGNPSIDQLVGLVINQGRI